MEAKSVKKKGKVEENKRHIKTFWKLFGTGILIVLLLFLLTSWGVFGKLPDETSLENPEKDLATQIISSDGQVIGKFFKENRTPVQFEYFHDEFLLEHRPDCFALLR